MINWMGTGTLPPALQKRNDILCYAGVFFSNPNAEMLLELCHRETEQGLKRISLTLATGEQC